MTKKKYSINWENEEPVSFEVDGVLYASLDQISDETDRQRLTTMMDGSLDDPFEQEFKEFDEEFKKDLEVHKKASANAEKIIIRVFTGVAIVLLLIAFVASANAILKIVSEESATGRIVEIVERREYINEQDRIVQDYYYPVVEYVSKDGRSHSVQMTEGSSAPSHEVGDKVTVLYDPEHPLDARIQSFGSSALMWVLPGITGILGLAFLVAVMAVQRFMPSTQETQNELV